MVKTKTYNLTVEEKGRLEKAAREILGRHGEVLFAYLFGSFEDTQPVHDLDIGVYTANADRKTSTNYVLNLAEELSGVLKLPIDVRLLNVAPLPFCYHVIRGKLLYEKDEAARSAFVERTVQRYLDIEPLLRKGLKEAFGS